MYKHICMAAALFLASSAATAGVCDFRPSRVVGATASAVSAEVGAAVSVLGAGLHAAGFYTLTHATTGAVMLGSTAAGSSAAGTVGIIAGTGSGVGATAAVVMAPVVIGAAAAAVAGGGMFELACYVAARDF